MNNLDIENISNYLNKRKVRFAISKKPESTECKLIGISVKKYGKFWKANGKIISGNIAKAILNEK